MLDPGFHDALAAGQAFAAAGADALMVLTPYYTDADAGRASATTSCAIADASPVPILIYEIPYRTRIAIAPEVLHELSRHPNIIGMKACNTDMYHFLKVRGRRRRESFTVLSGEDTLFPVQMAAGAKGGIVVTASPAAAHLAPALRGVRRRAAPRRRCSCTGDLIPLLDLAFAETNPGPLKSVLDLVGVDAPRVLQPLVAPAHGAAREAAPQRWRACCSEEAAL